MSAPAVSIVMPLYNAGHWAAESMASVQGQTFPDWELIVVDDGSTDDGPGKVTRLAASDSRIRFLPQPNSGPSVARNRGAAEARGQWLVFLDADDLLPPERLMADLEMAQRHGPAAVICGGVEWFTDALKVLHTSLPHPSMAVNRWRHSFYSQLYFGAMLIPTAAFRAVNGFDSAPQRNYAEDYDFSLRLLEQTPALPAGRVSVRIRKHPQNRSGLAAQTVGAQTVDLLWERWRRPLPDLPRAVMALAASFWRPEARAFSDLELHQIITWQKRFSESYCRTHPASLAAVKREWEAMLAVRLAAGGYPVAVRKQLLKMEKAQRGLLAMLRVWLRLRRLGGK